MFFSLKKGFPPFPNEPSLKLALVTVCAPYGKVKSLEVFPPHQDSAKGQLTAFCLLQLDSPSAQAALRSHLQLGTFGDHLAFYVDVGDLWIGPRL